MLQNTGMRLWKITTERTAMKKILALCLLLALLTGCAAVPQEESFAPAETERLVIYTSHKKEVWQPIVQEFESRTGIWVRVVEGGTNELLERLEGEKAVPEADVMFGGSVENLEAAESLFAPYRSAYADDLLPRYLGAEDLWTPFSALPLVLIYNPKLVGGEAVTGWADLTDPGLRGRIAFADPGVSGSSYTALATMVQALGGEKDEILQRFAANLQGKQLSASGDVLSAVARGESWVGVTLEETASRRIAAGDQLVMVYPKEGTSCVPDGCALISGCPHPENAKAFIDFTVSRDVQQLLQERFCRRPVRKDLEAGSTLPSLSKLKQVDYNLAWAVENRDRMLMSWEFYLGGEEQP